MCRAHATVRGVLGALVEGGDGERTIVVDMEAGLEHLGRATARHVDVLAAVVEPYFRALETGRRVVELAGEIGVPRLQVIANKVRGDADREAIAAFCERHGLPLGLEVPWDASFLAAERSGRAPLDHSPGSPGVRAVAVWGDGLVSS